jgi:hypothetical protein
VLIWAAEDPLAYPVSSALRGRLQDEVSEYPGAHVVRGCAGWGLPADSPEKEPGAARVGIVPGGVGLAAEYVIRQWLEWGSAATGHGRLKLGERPSLEIYLCTTGGEKKGLKGPVSVGDVDVAGRARIICHLPIAPSCAVFLTTHTSRSRAPGSRQQQCHLRIPAPQSVQPRVSFPPRIISPKFA